MNRFLPPHRFAAAVACTFAFSALLVPVVEAGGKPKPKERDYKQYYDEIVSVDATAHTATVATMVKEVPIGKQAADATPKAAQQEKVTTYRLTDRSEIEVNGKKADLAALNKGMKVEVTKGMDASIAARITSKQ